MNATALIFALVMCSVPAQPNGCTFINSSDNHYTSLADCEDRRKLWLDPVKGRAEVFCVQKEVPVWTRAK